MQLHIFPSQSSFSLSNTCYFTKMYIFITFSQACTIHPFACVVRFVLLGLPRLSIPVQVLGILYGVVLPQLCLKVNTVQSLALDYTVSFYPLVLLLITYLLIKLHDNFLFAVKVWRPFHRCFARFDRQWDVKTSIIDGFIERILLPLSANTCVPC